MKKTIYTLILALITLTLLAGCTGDKSPAEPTATEAKPTAATSEKILKIGFSAGFTKVQHWQLEILGAETAAKDLGAEFIFEYANGDPTKQIADIENMVEKGIDMLVVGPADSEGIVPTIKSLQEKGVAVGTSDIGVTGTDVAFHVASDNYAIGVTAADYVGKLLEGKGKIAIVGWAAASATADREKGFVDTIEASYPDIEIISHQDVQSDRQISLSTSENIIQANSDIKLIFGANAECALGAYAATESMNRKDIYIIAVDTDNEVMDAILNGSNLVATVAQDPFTMGYQAVSNAVKFMRGEKVENIAIPHELVTKENAAKIVERDQNHLKNAK
ncbi:MAG: sugar ABC transporter substrate-binding protein [Anaerolineaceae bacterium]